MKKLIFKKILTNLFISLNNMEFMFVLSTLKSGFVQKYLEGAYFYTVLKIDWAYFARQKWSDSYTEKN